MRLLRLFDHYLPSPPPTPAAVVVPKAEKLLKVSIQPYISSILDALMEPTSRGFSEVRDLFFRELVDMSKNTINEGTKETVAQVGTCTGGDLHGWGMLSVCCHGSEREAAVCPQHMEKISTLAFHPVKMQSCYQKVEVLSLEGLQQRFDVSSPSVFVHRAQILMREVRPDACPQVGPLVSVAMVTVMSERN